MRLNLTERSKVLVLTGAGVSAESGVPTFRDSDGLWEGHQVEDVATPEGFDADAELVWRFYSLRREAAVKVHPNPGHVALAKLEGRLGDRFLMTTQNVDGLHARAGSRRMIAMHGELFMSRCEDCNKPFKDTRLFLKPPLPTCANCGGRERPHIVWFGEALERGHMDRLYRFIEDAGSDLVFLAIGTSGLVYPAAGLVTFAKTVGGTTWLVDLSPSDDAVGRYDHVVRGKSGEVLPDLFGV